VEKGCPVGEKKLGKSSQTNGAEKNTGRGAQKRTKPRGRRGRISYIKASIFRGVPKKKKFKGRGRGTKQRGKK